tara:strand:+ start:403 stop:759 length:357 start_codon:yes stop_codon:yes gene_type:complete
MLIVSLAPQRGGGANAGVGGMLIVPLVPQRGGGANAGAGDADADADDGPAVAPGLAVAAASLGGPAEEDAMGGGRLARTTTAAGRSPLFRNFACSASSFLSSSSMSTRPDKAQRTDSW